MCVGGIVLGSSTRFVVCVQLWYFLGHLDVLARELAQLRVSSNPNPKPQPCRWGERRSRGLVKGTHSEVFRENHA